MADTIITVVFKDTKLTAKQAKAIRRRVEAVLTGKTSGGAEGQDVHPHDPFAFAPFAPLTSVSQDDRR